MHYFAKGINGSLMIGSFLKVYYRGIKTMKAWQSLTYGSPESLQLISSARIPVLTNPFDVLVKVHATSVNPLDIRMLEGYGATIFNAMRCANSLSFSSQAFPLTFGRDFSGTVIYVGNGVKSIKCGDEVWGVISPEQNGSHAEYVLASSYSTSKKPATISHVEAASLPYAALTAWSAISTFGGLSEKSAYGKRVLVTGASGGVGTFAVQLLKAWGAEVTVTCSSDAQEMMQDLGADNVLDYHSAEFKSDLRQLRDLDLIFDNVGGDYPVLTMNLLKTWKNSKYVTIVSPLLKNTDDHGIVIGTLISTAQAACDTVMSIKDGRSFRWAYFIPNGYALKTIATLVVNKQIVPVIDTIFTFEDLPQAYKKVLQGHARGKIIIDVTGKENVEESSAV